MHLPIQYAMFYPDRVYNSAIRSFDPVGTGALTFEQWDDERFPCFGMALDVAKRGGTWPAALAGADAAAVQRFLEGRIGFLDIGTVIREALSGHRNAGEPTVEQIMDAAQSARRRVGCCGRGVAVARTTHMARVIPVLAVRDIHSRDGPLPRGQGGSA